MLVLCPNFFLHFQWLALDSAFNGRILGSGLSAVSLTLSISLTQIVLVGAVVVS